MKLDFTKINKEKIGYELTLEPHRFKKGSMWYEVTPVIFEDFIQPFYDSDSYKKVYNDLKGSLDELIKNQDSVANGKGAIFLDILSKRTLYREGIRNAMDLILKNYL